MPGFCFFRQHKLRLYFVAALCCKPSRVYTEGVLRTTKFAPGRICPYLIFLLENFVPRHDIIIARENHLNSFALFAFNSTLSL